MFFANLEFGGRLPKDCPDNDNHNVDTIDGLVLPSIVALAAAGRQEAIHRRRHSTVEKRETDEAQDDVGASCTAPTLLLADDARTDAARCVAVTRNSKGLEEVAGAWAELLATLTTSEGSSAPTTATTSDLSSSSSSPPSVHLLPDALTKAARALGLTGPPSAERAGAMVSCYMDQSVRLLPSSHHHHHH